MEQLCTRSKLLFIITFFPIHHILIQTSDETHYHKKNEPLLRHSIRIFFHSFSMHNSLQVFRIVLARYLHSEKRSEKNWQYKFRSHSHSLGEALIFSLMCKQKYLFFIYYADLMWNIHHSNVIGLFFSYRYDF